MTFSARERRTRSRYGITLAEAISMQVCLQCRRTPGFDKPLQLYQQREWRQTGLCPECLEAELRGLNDNKLFVEAVIALTCLAVLSWFIIFGG